MKSFLSIVLCSVVFVAIARQPSIAVARRPWKFVPAYTFNCTGGVLTPSQRRDITNQHNVYRSRLAKGLELNKDNKAMPRAKNMYKLEWDCGLEMTAQNWANTCIFDHSERNQRNEAGENLYAHSSTAPLDAKISTAALQAGKGWWDELKKLFPNNPTNYLTEEIFDKGIGHFTQMAWGDTYAIGCGIATNCQYKGMNRLIVVCHYQDSGNILDEQIYEIGEPCMVDSHCTSQKCSTDLGLCKKEIDQ